MHHSPPRESVTTDSSEALDTPYSAIVPAVAVATLSSMSLDIPAQGYDPLAWDSGLIPAFMTQTHAISHDSPQRARPSFLQFIKVVPVPTMHDRASSAGASKNARPF